MAKDYMDSWELNGDTVLIQDFGKGKPDGVAVLDEYGKIPMADIPAIYSSKLLTSPKDEDAMTLKEWVEDAVPFIRKDYGNTYNLFDENCIVYDYCAEKNIVLARKFSSSVFGYVIKVGNGTWQRLFLTGHAVELKYCVNNVIGLKHGNSLYYTYISAINAQVCNYTYITTPDSLSVKNVFNLNNTLYYLGSKVVNETTYITLMTSTDGINFTEIFEHEYTGTTVSTNDSSAVCFNGIYVFMTSTYRITINNGSFYYEEFSATNWVYVEFFADVFTTGRYWSEDGIHWTAVTDVDGNPEGSGYRMIHCPLFNRIIVSTAYSEGSPYYYYTEDGKTTYKYTYEAYIGDSSISTNRAYVLALPIVDNGIAFFKAHVNDLYTDYNVGVLKTTDGIHFECVMNLKERYPDDPPNANLFNALNMVCDKGTLFISLSWSNIELYKYSLKTPQPNLWLPYSTFLKNYPKISRLV